MPAFTIVDFGLQAYDKWVYNDKTRWEFVYKQIQLDMEELTVVSKEIGVLPCMDVIGQMSDLTEA